MAKLSPGDQIPELKVTPDKYLPHRYAGASGDFNPIHIDAEFAQAVGLPRNILHGLYGMAQVARATVQAAGGDPRSSAAWGSPSRRSPLPAQCARSATGKSWWTPRRTRARTASSATRKPSSSPRAELR